MTVLVVDGGRSGCRARLRPATGPPVEAAGPGLPPVGGAGALQGILDVLDEVLGRLPAAQADVVVAGLAGLVDQRDLAPALGAALAARTGARRIVVTGDLVAAHAGALRLDPGVVVAAGTGAVAFAVGPDGRTARADGWGHLLGDEGGGFWIGRAGLAAALADADGRGGSPHLRARAEACHGPLERLADIVHAEPVGVAARFAPEVAAAAREGDAVAAGLWVQAGRRLAATAAAAAERALPADRAPVCPTGGLFGAGDLLLEPFRDELARRAPRLRVRPPAGSALDGAELLATVDPLPPGLGAVTGAR